MSTNLDRHLHLLRDHLITFDSFASKTHKEFERMAVYLLRRWIPPCWYAVDDVVQELLLGTYLCLPKWDPSRGTALSRYVVYNSMSHAKRALHKARGAKLSGTADKNSSHIEVPFTVFGGGKRDESYVIDAMLREEPVAESVLIDREEREEATAAALESCNNETERAIIRALAGAGDLKAGAEVIYSDIDNRIDMRLVSEEHAARVVMRTVRAVVDRQSLAS